MSSASFFLNMLRFVSAQLVVIGHVSVLAANVLNDKLHASKPAQLIFLAQIGTYLFFALSGFLIAQSVFSKKRLPGYGFKSYFIDRFARIYSGLVPALIIIVLIGTIHIGLNADHYAKFFGGRVNLSPLALAGNLLMLEEFPPGDTLATLTTLRLPLPATITHFGDAIQIWTLMVEWWLYMFFGWLVLGSIGGKRDTKFWLVLALFAFIPASLLLFSKASLVLTWFLGALATFAFYRLAAGNGGAAEQQAEGRRLVIPAAEPWYWKAAVLFSVLTAFRVMFDSTAATDLYSDSLLPLLLVASFVFLLLSFEGWPRVGEKAEKTAAFLAGYSYSLYLLHFTVISLVFVLKPPLPLLGVAVLAFVAANAVSATVAYFTEMRHKQLAAWLKKRFDRQPA